MPFDAALIVKLALQFSIAFSLQRTSFKKFQVFARKSKSFKSSPESSFQKQLAKISRFCDDILFQCFYYLLLQNVPDLTN